MPATTGRTLRQGTKGALATTSYPGHVATAGRDCITCHASAAPAFASWASATYVHLASDTNCVNCHNGLISTGLTTPPHIPTASLQCSNCHSNSAASFVTYTMNHASVSGTRCDACHNGAYTSQGSKRRAWDRIVSGSCPDQRLGLRGLPCQRGDDLLKLVRRRLRSRTQRHQLRQLPQRHDRHRTHHAPAYPDRGDPVQQLSHQYGTELHHLHDEPRSRSDDTLRRLPQRVVYVPGHEGCAGNGVVPRPCGDRGPGLRDLPCQHRIRELGRWHLHPSAVRYQLHELSQRHDRDRLDDAAAHPDRVDPVQQLSHAIRRRVSPPIR